MLRGSKSSVAKLTFWTRGSGGRRPVIVDQDRERDLLVRHERFRVDLVAGPDGDDIRTGRLISS